MKTYKSKDVFLNVPGPRIPDDQDPLQLCQTLHDLVDYWRERALKAEEELPKVNIMCETISDGIVGLTYLNVVRVEREDDESITVVTDHWPR